MTTALQLLLLQGILGAFDTVWFHEFRGRLPTLPTAIRELRIHAARDFIYAVLFGTLGWLAWYGLFAWVLLALLGIEIGITLWDFLEEDRTRKLPAGERVTHALMGIVYGAFLACFFPVVLDWSLEPTGLDTRPARPVSWVLVLMAAGVFGSGVRDLVSSLRLRRDVRVRVG